MQKRSVLLELVLLLFIIIVLSGFASASYKLNSSSIDGSYGPFAAITGKINISFNSEPYNTMIKATIDYENYQMTLKDFLYKNSLSSPAGYSCSTSNCDMEYFASGSGLSTKTFSLNSGESKVIGFNLSENFYNIEENGFNLNVVSNVSASCSLPLKIDVLDDGYYDWVANKGSLDSCSSEPSYGCYSSSSTSEPRFFGANTYCNRIGISDFPKINVGALIESAGTSSGIFTMRIIGENITESSCAFTANGPGLYSCDINVSSITASDLDICISSLSSNYSIKMIKSQAGCGYVDDPANGLNYSFAIFAKPYKYEAIGNFSLNLNNNANLKSAIEDYLQNNYGNDCSDGCVIPIKFISSQNQEIILSEPRVKYKLSSGIKEINSLFDLIQQSPLLTMNYRNLDISKLGAVVPEKGSNLILKLFIGDKKILSKNITILDIPVIESISTQKSPAGISTYFSIKTSGANITKYKWNFGDNTSVQETTIPEIYYAYGNIGTYNLKIEAINSFGNYSQIFAIQVTSPGEYILLMINYTNARVTSLKTLLASLPQFVNDYYKNKLGLDALLLKLSNLKVDYDNAGGSATKYTSIALTLTNLSVPDSIKTTKATQSIKFLVDKTIINPADVETISGEKRGTGTDEAYKENIYAWNFNSLDINVDEEVYGVYYGNLIDSSLTRIKVKVSPKEDLEDVYLIINAKKSDIIFKDTALGSQAKDLGASTGLSLGSLSSLKEIEFLLSSKFNILDTPIYFATKFSLLPKDFNPQGCNYNQICETGENSKNCRNDCKPVGLILMWLGLVLLVFLIAYLALQEWYKRNYESYLFKNKNDLFNLIHFIDNAEKQKLTKSDLYKKLEEKSWKHEQIEYAYRKYKGLRTGMWEIPIFKFIENRKVDTELLKRKNLGVNPQIIPKPIIAFNPAEKRPMFVPRAPIPQIQKPLIPQQNPNSSPNLNNIKNLDSAPVQLKPQGKYK